MKHFIFFILSAFFMASTLCGCKRMFDKLFEIQVFNYGTAYINDVKYEATDSVTILGPKSDWNTTLFLDENEMSRLRLRFGYVLTRHYLINFYFCTDTIQKVPIRGSKYTVIYKKGANDYGNEKKEFYKYIDSLHAEHPDSSFCMVIFHPSWTSAAYPLEGYVNFEDFVDGKCRGNFVLKTNYESSEKYNIIGNFDVYFRKWNMTKN